MDLFAYSQIDDLDDIAKANNIDIPRLRGYRSMKYEFPISEDGINSAITESELSVTKDMCICYPLFSNSPLGYELSDRTDQIKKYYLDYAEDEDGYKDAVRIRWDRIHGWKRRNLKFELKRKRKAVIENCSMFNKYCGRDDVLCIHARIGGNNWNDYNGAELERQPWFLGRVDDFYDSTYCDIYAKIDTKEPNDGILH